MIRTSSVNGSEAMEDGLMAVAVECLMAKADPQQSCEWINVEVRMFARRDPVDTGSSQVELLELMVGSQPALVDYRPRWKKALRRALNLY